MDHDLPEVDIELDIPFYDLDPAEIVWFGNIYKYFEKARAKLMSSIEYSMNDMKKSGYFWPVIESKCRHKNRIEYGDQVRINAKVAEYENRLKINYMGHRIDDGERVAMGHTIQVAVEIDTGEMQLESPPVLFEKLGIPYPNASDHDE